MEFEAFGVFEEELPGDAHGMKRKRPGPLIKGEMTGILIFAFLMRGPGTYWSE